MSTNTHTAAPALVDVRGPRFAAWVTTVVIVATLIAAGFSSTAAAVILAVQAVVFAIGAWRGPRQHPYGLIFQRVSVSTKMRRLIALSSTMRTGKPVRCDCRSSPCGSSATSNTAVK